MIPLDLDALQRFFASVEQDAGGCWLWTGRLWKGYARISVCGKTYKAHRFAYAMLVDSSLPDDLLLDHKCRVRPCVNPQHHEPLTSRQNTLRGLADRKRRGVLPLLPGFSLVTS